MLLFVKLQPATRANSMFVQQAQVWHDWLCCFGILFRTLQQSIAKKSNFSSTAHSFPFFAAQAQARRGFPLVLIKTPVIKMLWREKKPFLKRLVRFLKFTVYQKMKCASFPPFALERKEFTACWALHMFCRVAGIAQLPVSWDFWSNSCFCDHVPAACKTTPYKPRYLLASRSFALLCLALLGMLATAQAISADASHILVADEAKCKSSHFQPKSSTVLNMHQLERWPF
jgi:hypothetical protein